MNFKLPLPVAVNLAKAGVIIMMVSSKMSGNHVLDDGYTSSSDSESDENANQLNTENHSLNFLLKL